jgi:hypothetical protein
LERENDHALPMVGMRADQRASVKLRKNNQDQKKDEAEQSSTEGREETIQAQKPQSSANDDAVVDLQPMLSGSMSSDDVQSMRSNSLVRLVPIAILPPHQTSTAVVYV